MFPKIDIKRFNIYDDEKMVFDLLAQEKVLLVHGRGFCQCARSFCTVDVHVAVDSLCRRQENKTQDDVHEMADGAVFHPHGRHIAQQRHQDIPRQLLCERSPFLASGQSSAGNTPAFGYALGTRPT